MTFKFLPLGLSSLVAEAVGANMGLAEKHSVAFVLADSDPSVTIRGDGERLIQVIANLLSNAAKFSPEGGDVKISVTHGEGVARVSIADHGPGIPEAFRDKIFGRFSQADTSDARRTGGTGLGLNISKSIIDQHGGTIGFDSEVGVGSTFFFTLPIAE